MKKGINVNGELICHEDAKQGDKFYCQHCTEELIIRRGKGACFAHIKIKDRTPLQRACPEYHENSSYKKIANPLDRLYINNGGVPLYLYRVRDKFQLRAYFPTLSERKTKELIERNSKLCINGKTEYYVENLNYYVVDSIQEWIDIKISPSSSSEEVKRKWLWGIRGVDINKDIYHVNSEGGYRLAIKAKVYIGKKYRMMFIDKPPQIRGINFSYQGEINLQREVKVYQIEITTSTEEAKKFIEAKGYKLLKAESIIQPIWPPATISGNEIISDSDKLWFYNGQEDDYLYEVRDRMLRKITNNHIIQINNLSTFIERMLVVSDLENQSRNDDKAVNEIKYMLVYKNQLDTSDEIVPQIITKDEKGNILDEDGVREEVFNSSKIFVESDIDNTLILKKGEYIIKSGQNKIDTLKYATALYIDLRCNRIIRYEFNKPINTISNKEDIDWEEVYKNLYKYGTGYTIQESYIAYGFIKIMKDNLTHDNRQTYRLIYKWVKERKIPIYAHKYLGEILERGFLYDK